MKILLLAIAMSVGFFLTVSLANRKNDTILLCDEQTDVEEKKQCWANAVESELKKNAISEALDLVANVYDKNPAFAETCHGLTHEIGQKAYTLFIQKKPFELNGKTAYCSYGFYHGFMEALVRGKADVSQARSFCAYVGEKLAAVSPDAAYACYHGIGHGWTQVHDQKLYSNERAVVAPALALCKQVSVEKSQLLRCATGVFDSISIAYYNKENGMVMKKNDPLWLCREQDEQFKEACYRDMMPAILWLGGYTLEKSTPYVVNFVEKNFQDIAIETLASDSIRYVMGKGEAGFIQYLSVCRMMPQNLRIPCVSGLATGIMEFGIPGKAHLLGFSVCSNTDLSHPEQRACYRNILQSVTSRYSQKDADQICKYSSDAHFGDCYESTNN